MLAVSNGRMPTIVMGNSAILPSLHPSANAEADAIDTLNIANTAIGERLPRRLPRVLNDVFATAMGRGDIGKNMFEAPLIPSSSRIQIRKSDQRLLAGGRRYVFSTLCSRSRTAASGAQHLRPIGSGCPAERA
jgi:hypothetical protein